MKYFFLVVAVIYGAAIYGGFAPMPFKATDPSDPRFNINRFRFEDYPSEDSLQKTIEKILPVGTGLEKIDFVLVEIGGAKKSGPFKLGTDRKKQYSDPENYITYYYSKMTLFALVRTLFPLPVKPDRLISVEINTNDKSVYIGTHR